MNSPHIDFIIRVKNGYLAEKQSVSAMYSKLNASVADILKKEGYIKAFSIVEDGNKKSIHVDLQYIDEEPAIQGVKIYSKPGQRQYFKKEAVRPVLGGLGISIISTPLGVMTDKSARKSKTGGEILYSIW